jgi:NADH-quinone oxidoreductase subunit J
MIANILFYMFSFFLIFAASSVVLSRSTIHSALFLILSFFNAAGLFVLQGAEFLAMLLIVVYVGAVAVLFLFVIMMFHDRDYTNKKWHPWVIPSVSIAGVLFIELLTVFWIYSKPQLIELEKVVTTEQMSNIKQIADVLYDSYIFPFQLSGMLLLLAMVGAVALTYTRSTHKRQNIMDQVKRTSRDTLVMNDVSSNKGVS